MKIYLITTNEGKIKEISAALVGSEIELIPTKLHEIIEPQSNDMIEVSKSKARQAFDILKKDNIEDLAVLVDDAGIYFEKYNEFPGVMTKYLIDGVGMAGVKKLFDEGDRAQFKAVLSYMDDTLAEPLSFVGVDDGKLSLVDDNMDLEKGLPYNHIFIPDGYDKFIYQIPVEDRFEFHHRMKAVKKFLEYIEKKD